MWLGRSTTGGLVERKPEKKSRQNIWWAEFHPTTLSCCCGRCTVVGDEGQKKYETDLVGGERNRDSGLGCYSSVPCQDLPLVPVRPGSEPRFLLRLPLSAEPPEPGNIHFLGVGGTAVASSINMPISPVLRFRVKDAG